MPSTAFPQPSRIRTMQPIAGGHCQRGNIAMRLIVKSGSAAGREFEIDREMTVGRAPASDIVITDSGVSSRHASLRPVESGVEMTDLGSLNGTFVDGRKIESPTVIRPGVEIRFSTTVVEVAPS